jgi:hypothetical protein
MARGLRRTPLARPSRLVLGTTTSAGDLPCWGRGLRLAGIAGLKSVKVKCCLAQIRALLVSGGFIVLGKGAPI